jgi:hypothetical protein
MTKVDTSTNAVEWQISLVEDSPTDPFESLGLVETTRVLLAERDALRADRNSLINEQAALLDKYIAAQDALTTARREAAGEMRARAAKVEDEIAQSWYRCDPACFGDPSDLHELIVSAESRAAAIRALPLSPEPQEPMQ